MLCSCDFMFTLLALALSAGAVCPPGFLDTGQQAQNGAILYVNGSVDGSPVDLNSHGVLPYCAQASPVCTLGCRVTFETIHSPSYYINGSCFSAGGNTSVKELEKIGVNATHAHPNYLVKFPCRAISEYTCYMNETVYTQVEVRPDATACGVTPVDTNITTLPGSNGNSTSSPTTVPHHPFPFLIAGLIAGGILVLTTIVGLVLLIAVLHYDQLKTQGQRVVRRLCPCCPQGQVDVEVGQVGSVEATADNGNHEMVPGVSSSPGGGVPAAIVVRVVRRLCPCCPQGQVDVEPGPSAVPSDISFNSTEEGSSMHRDDGDGGEEMSHPLSVSATNEDGNMKLVAGRYAFC